MAEHVLPILAALYLRDTSLQGTGVDQLEPYKIQDFPEVYQPQTITPALATDDSQLTSPKLAHLLHPTPQEPRRSSPLLLAVSVYPQRQRYEPSLGRISGRHAQEQELCQIV